MDDDRDFAAGRFLDYAQHFPDGKTPPGAEVDSEVCSAFGEMGKSLNMGAREICDVNIVPYAGPVRGVVVIAEYLQVRNPAKPRPAAPAE